jgi:hypothetical protein
MTRSRRDDVRPRRLAWVGPGLVALLVVLAVAGGVVAAVAGWRAGSATRSPTPVVSGDSQAVTLGPAHLTVPHAWTPVNPARAGVSGLDLSPTLAFQVVPGLSGHALVSLAAPADGSLIPSSLRRALKATPGTPRLNVLAGHHAWSYLRVATRRGDTVMDITVVPTSAGVLAVACAASRPVFVAVAGCEQDVQGISLPGGRVFAPAPELAFRLRAGAALERLKRARDLGYQALRAARTRGAQAQALREVASAYAGAAGGLAPLASGNGTASGLVAAMRDAARAYRSAGAAAAANAVSRYGVGRARVRAAEARVAGALDRVTRGVG